MGKFSDALRAEVSSYGETEWNGQLGGVDVKLMSKPITSADMTRIGRAHPDFTRSPNMEGMVDLLIIKATDDNGDKAFDKGDKPMLMRIGTNRIGEIFHALFADQLVEDDDEKFEERVKN